MEARGCSQRWRMQLPEVKHSRRCLSVATREDERGEAERQKAKDGLHKSVTVAPASRCLTGRQYVKRKPLFCAEQHTSILKKHTQKDERLVVGTREESQQNTNRSLVSKTPESFSLSHSDMSLASASREDLGPPTAVSQPKNRPLPGSRWAPPGLWSSILESHRLNPPLRPRLTSTVLHPTYTPRSGHSRPSQFRVGGGGGREGIEGAESNLWSSGGHSSGCPASPYQANYWACAIPAASPPSPDRHCAGWDPNREYQALLDYTYPLRPGQLVSEWDRADLRGESMLQTDPNLQDSGIELDYLCSSTSLSGLGISVSSVGQTGERRSLSVDQRSPDLQSGTLTDPVGLSWDKLDCSKDRGGMDCHTNGGHYQRRAPSSSPSSAYIRSTRVLPQSRGVCGDMDEEFWPLPEQLEELQLLATQVREAAAQLSRPVTASWESLGPDANGNLSSITVADQQQAGVKEPEEGKDEQARLESSAAHTGHSAADHRASGAVRGSPGAWVEPDGGWSALREAEALVEQLGGLTLSPSQRSSQDEPEHCDSLTQHIQVFCSHLEQLIQQLYAASEKMELLAAPTVDIDSVKLSLAQYQSFQREVSSHQPLASCVLHTGQLLLSCINTTSPFLRETLLLIERQSGALETHTEHFFSSILSAMDSLTQPGPVQQSTDEHLGPLGGSGGHTVNRL